LNPNDFFAELKQRRNVVHMAGYGAWFPIRVAGTRLPVSDAANIR
jgi:hypothetical protein